MTQQEILEGNKLITNFVQLRGEYDEDKDLIYLESDIDGKGVYSFSELKYHSSWDWLMPCIEKCLATIVNSEEYEYHYAKIHDALWSINISEVYNEVVEFIKWYNEECTE